MERFPSKTHERAFILYQFIAAYLLPVLTISFCYTLLVKRVGQPTVEPVDNNYQVRTWLLCFVLCLVVITWISWNLVATHAFNSTLKKYNIHYLAFNVCLMSILENVWIHNSIYSGYSCCTKPFSSYPTKARALWFCHDAQGLHYLQNRADIYLHSSKTNMWLGLGPKNVVKFGKNIRDV